MTDGVVTGVANGYPLRPRPANRSADWGGKALLVCALALLMAIPGAFVLLLVNERAHRAESVITDVSNLQGGSQQLLGPLLVAPYTYTDTNGHVQSAWYVVSPEQGSAQVHAKTELRHKGIFEVPVYSATAEVQATFAPVNKDVSLPATAKIDWSQAQIVLGLSDLRGAKTDINGEFAGAAGKVAMPFAPSSDVSLGQPQPPNGSAAASPAAMAAAAADGAAGGSGYGLVVTPAGPLLASATGGTFHAALRFTGAQRLSVLPFAKSTQVTIDGDWKSPSFNGGFPPEKPTIKENSFSAAWNVPFIGRGLSAQGTTGALSLESLGAKDLGVTFVPTNNPYQNVMRALKYAVMFVGLVFLTFFVFEALSGRRLHPAQYVLVGLAQMVFYLLLLSLSEYIGFDAAFALAAVGTVALITLYARAAFGARRYGVQALVVFSTVYALIYLLMRLEDFALLAGSLASFVGLAAAMYLTRNIEWYGGKAEPQPGPYPVQPPFQPPVQGA